MEGSVSRNSIRNDDENLKRHESFFRDVDYSEDGEHCPRCGEIECDGSCPRFPATQAGLAERLLQKYKRTFLWVPKRREWMVYRQNFWHPDQGEVRAGLLKMGREMGGEAICAADSDERTRLLKFALECEHSSTIGGAEQFCRDLAHTVGRVRDPKEFDQDLGLMHCKNGVLSLRTGRVREHRCEDLFTRSTGVDFDANAKSPLWTKLIETAIPDNATRSYVQRAVGSSLMGPREERIFLVHGPTATSKSTFMEAIHSAIGNYYQTAGFETFLRGQPNGGPRQDLMVLQGSRIVAASESEDGHKLALGMLKTISGGEEITSRMLYGKEVSYKPSYVIWLRSNFRPYASSDDESAWRRLVEIPFHVQVAEKDRDPAVKAELVDAEQSGPAILAWLARGCTAYQERGLGTSPGIEAATKAYRHECDPLGTFLEDRCSEVYTASVQLYTLRRVYDQWCQENKASVLGMREFRKRMEGRGFGWQHTRTGNIVLGLALKAQESRRIPAKK